MAKHTFAFGAKKARLVILTIFAFLLAILFLLPMAYTVVSSLKPVGKIFTVPIQWIPDEISLENFTKPFLEKNFARYFLNSTIVAVLVTVSELFFSSLAGYSLARFDYKGRELFFIIVLITMMVPIEATIVPLAIIVKNLGWMSTYRGLVIPVMVTPFAIFWMRQFILTIPRAYVEAGRIDGYGEFKIFIRLILPLCQPALGAVAIFTYMYSWNSLIWPLIVATKERLWTIPVGLIALETLEFKPYHELLAMSVATVFPTLVLFIFLRGRLIKGIAMVGIKG